MRFDMPVPAYDSPLLRGHCLPQCGHLHALLQVSESERIKQRHQ